MPDDNGERRPDGNCEHRKNYILGVSPGEWLMLATIVAGGASAWATIVAKADETQRRSLDNAKAIDQIRTSIKVEVRRSEERTQHAIEGSEQRMREDIKELRQLIIRRTP